MTIGWNILARLEALDPEQDISSELVSTVCDDLIALNDDQLRTAVANSLRDSNRARYAAGVQGQFRDDNTLFGLYFANEAQAAGLGVPGAAHRLDGPRASIVFYMSYALQETLVAQLRAIPTAAVMNAEHSPNRAAFAKVYRFVALHQLVRTMKAVQHELEGFSGLIPALLATSAGNELPTYGYSREWPFDAPLAVSEILLGFLPANAPTTLNTGILTSPIVAASALRSHLEAVVFCFDFEATMHGLQRVQAADFDGALAVHEQAGRLTRAERMWAVETYGLLSESLHGGRILTYGEVWALKRLVRALSQRITRGAAVPPIAVNPVPPSGASGE